MASSSSRKSRSPHDRGTAYATLTRAEAERVLARHPELRGQHQSWQVLALLVENEEEADAVGAVVELVRSQLDSSRASRDQILRSLLPIGSLAGRGTVLQLRRNAEARLQLAEEFSLPGGAEVAAAAGSKAANAAALASRLGEGPQDLLCAGRGQYALPRFPVRRRQ